jgi:hypothetical protein
MGFSFNWAGVTVPQANIEGNAAVQNRSRSDGAAWGQAARGFVDRRKAEQAAKEEEILNTKVYSVYSGARLYHATTVCGTQSNRRELTVREAMAEGMGACKDCNPPVLQ